MGFIEYRDPLVGIISLFSIILFAWGVFATLNNYKKNQKSKQLEKFVENFAQNSPDQDDFEKLIIEFPASAKMLYIVANGFFSSGEYEKSARFFTLILKHTVKTDKETNAKIMLALARSFIKLGFMGRAKTVLIELLRLQPRNEAALKELVGIAAMSNDFDDSLGALEALSQLNQKYEKCSRFFKNMEMARKGKLDYITTAEPYFIREQAKVFSANNQLIELFQLAIDNGTKPIVDILWYTWPNQEHLDFVKKSDELLELYAAKGLISCNKFNTFEFELMSTIVDKNIGEILFEYRCNNCGKEELDYFPICKKCMTLSACNITPKLVKKSDRELYLESFS